MLVVLDTPGRLCRERNAARDRPVPAPALASQLARVRAVAEDVAAEGWDVVHVVQQAGGVASREPGPEPAEERRADGPRLVLQVSRFP